jgi:hypothetical protein
MFFVMIWSIFSNLRPRRCGVFMRDPHVEKRQREDDIQEALRTLEGALGDGSGTGQLAEDQTQAEKAADDAHKGIGMWQGVCRKTMAIAPVMAHAVDEVVDNLKAEHEKVWGTYRPGPSPAGHYPNTPHHPLYLTPPLPTPRLGGWCGV